MGHSILVTGGAGYLGSILVPDLLAVGHRVTVLDNFMYDQNSLGHVCANPNFDVVNGDARSIEVLKPLVAKADYVFPLAALVGAPLCKKDPIGATSTNRDAIATLSKLMSPQQRIVMPITNSGYGVGEQGKFCTEEFAAASGFALWRHQDRGGKDRARSRQFDQPALGHGVRHVAAHAHRSIGQQFRLSRGQ